MKDGMEVGKHDQKETNLSQPNMSAALLRLRKAHQSGDTCSPGRAFLPFLLLYSSRSPLTFLSLPSFFLFFHNFIC